jgi:hypothetical protein
MIDWRHQPPFRTSRVDRVVIQTLHHFALPDELHERDARRDRRLGEIEYGREAGEHVQPVFVAQRDRASVAATDLDEARHRC